MVGAMKNHTIISRAGGIDAVQAATKKKSRRTVEMWNAGAQPIPTSDWPEIKGLCNDRGQPVTNDGLVSAYENVMKTKMSRPQGRATA
jgi:hypothetical protein